MLAVVAMIAGVLTAIGGAASPAAAAPLSQTTLYTWNMQGGTNGVDGKWESLVNVLGAQAPIVLLQEAGSRPAGSFNVRHTVPAVNQPNAATPASYGVDEYFWAPTVNHELEYHYVYFLNTDPNGHRVNSAIVTRTPPDEIVVVTNPTNHGNINVGRPALGVRYGNDWFFTFHAEAAHDGSDAATMLAAINTFVRGRPGNETWTVGADFNREPGQLAVPNGAVLYNPNEPTHVSGSEWDYFVTDRPQGQIRTQVPNYRRGLSDHFPTRVGAIQAAGGQKVDFNGVPLGDQFTEGLNDSADGGYRNFLLTAIGSGPLTGEFGKRDLIGSTQSGSLPDKDEEAYQGITTNGLYDKIQVAKSSYYGPNRQEVFMLDTGYNDLKKAGDNTVEQAVSDLQRLITMLLALDPSKSVVVATLTPVSDPAVQARITEYNKRVRSLVETLQANGGKVTLADTATVTTADIADGLLPNANGYRKMSDAFFEGIAEAYFAGWLDPPPVSAPAGPVCAIYRAYGTPCGIAVSMARVLVNGYAGPLYQVQRLSDSALKDIGTVSGGYADAAAQDSFCGSASCVVNKIYDQTSNQNDLTLEVKGPRSIGTVNHRADAKALPVMLDGHKVYGLKVSGAVGYRNNATKGIATGSSPEGMYMVTSGTYNNADCCFDFGNAETDTADDRAGAMDALNFGTKCYFSASGCSGSGPWVEADLEDGLFNGGDGNNTNNKGNSSNFVTAMLKNAGGSTDPSANPGKDKYALLGGNAQSGPLSTWYEGPLPSRVTSGSYKLMKLQGGVVLGTGGDNSNGSIGAFFEGVMTQGYPSPDADKAVQGNIVAAKYTGDSKGLPIDPGTLGEGASATASQAVVHQGYTSVFTVNPSTGHLVENFLTHVGQPWQNQDLSDKFKVPSVMPGTQPVTLMHDGYLSVFTVAADSGHMIQSWIHLIGDDWQYTDLSTTGSSPTPPTDQTPTAVFHDGYASLFTVDAHRDLHETYLRFIGDTWHDLDLSGNGCAKLLPGTGPVAVFHGGYTSIFYTGPDKHLQECYYSGIGAPLAHHDLFAIGGAPLTVQTPGALVHDGYTSVFTAADPTQHLWETYLATIGAPWVSHDLSGGDTTVTAEPAPNVAPGTHPVAFYHGGYASVFTVNESTQDVQETFLTDIGDPWHSQNFTDKFGTGHTVTTPIPLLHPSESGDNTFASVFYVDEFTDHLRESYTPAIGTPWTDHDLTNQYQVPPVLVEATPTNQSATIHEGYTSVFSIDRSTGHLWETYLTAIGQAWESQDLSGFHVPKAVASLHPAVVMHDGILSVFTVNDPDGSIEETYLPRVGQAWVSKNLGVKAKFGTSPTAVFHAGYTSLYFVNPDGQLRESYFSAPGAAWTTIDLPAPKVEDNSSPAAVLHSGWVSVFTLDTGQHLHETYLSAIGDAWVDQDLSVKYSVPAAIKLNSPTAVVHQGWTSVYTVDATKHLQESYLPNISDAWITQDLTANFGAPTVTGTVAPTALYHTGYTSIYTVRSSDNHVMETYLPAIGGRWANQDMTTDQGLPTAETPISAVLHHDDHGGLTATSVYVIDRNSPHHLWEGYLTAINQKWNPKDFTIYGTPAGS